MFKNSLNAVKTHITVQVDAGDELNNYENLADIMAIIYNYVIIDTSNYNDETAADNAAL